MHEKIPGSTDTAPRSAPLHTVQQVHGTNSVIWYILAIKILCFMLMGTNKY
jgi:hypothetical protein